MVRIAQTRNGKSQIPRAILYSRESRRRAPFTNTNIMGMKLGKAAVVPDVADDPAWPPGTVRLEKLLGGADAEIILQPRPTSDPNDPLNCKYIVLCLGVFSRILPSAARNTFCP